MRTRHALATGLAAGLVAVAGCGSSSSGGGVASKSPDAIVAAATSTILKAQSVHVAGSVASGGSRIAIDFELVAGKGGRGSLTQDGVTIRLVRVGHDLYGNAGVDFWRRVASDGVAQRLRGKWLKVPANRGNWAAIARLLDFHTFFSQLASHGKRLAKGSVTMLNGRSVVPIQDKIGTLYVAATGKPYPIELVKSGTQTGTIVFDRFDEPVALSAPAGAVPAG